MCATKKVEKPFKCMATKLLPNYHILCMQQTTTNIKMACFKVREAQPKFTLNFKLNSTQSTTQRHNKKIEFT